MEKGLVFGLNIGELLTIYDHDSQSWKMSECLFTGDYGKYSEALPRSGIMLNGKISEQATWVHRTGGKGSGLLPTPRAQEIDDSNGDVCQESNSIRRKSGKRYGASLTTIIKHQAKWPTPRTRGLCGGSGHKKMLMEKFGNEEGKKIFNGGTLNPTWVDWLMGYPIEWTDLEASEMQLSLK